MQLMFPPWVSAPQIGAHTALTLDHSLAGELGGGFHILRGIQGPHPCHFAGSP